MEALALLAVVFVIILIIRLFGAWMLRINEVIKHQEETVKLLQEIKNQNNKL